MAGAVCVLTLMANQTANATCGDYLSHAGQQENTPGDLLLPPDQTPQKSPCTGPQCQNHRPDPAPESPLIVITSLKPACSLVFETVARRVPQSESTGYQTLILPGDHRQRIDRPPQISGS
jgi:hypothetical protein